MEPHSFYTLIRNVFQLMKMFEERIHAKRDYTETTSADVSQLLKVG